jgi:hypothetical protein
MDNGNAFYISNDQQVHIAVVPHCTFGMRTEEHNALWRECADEASQGALNERRQRRR